MLKDSQVNDQLFAIRERAIVKISAHRNPKENWSYQNRERIPILSENLGELGRDEFRIVVLRPRLIVWCILLINLGELSQAAPPSSSFIG